MTQTMPLNAKHLASSLDNGLILLQSLSKHQQQRKKLPATRFTVTDYLHYIESEEYLKILTSDELLCCYAAQLFNCEQATIRLIGQRDVTKHCAAISFDIEGKPHSFYIKAAWEGAIKEGIGLEFNNLLTDTPVRYLCSSSIVITENMFEEITPKLVYSIRDTPEYLFAFGAWEIFTQWLHLTDRKTSNIRWSGQRLANIDFGLVFYRGKTVFDSRFTITEYSESRHQGQLHALSHVLNKLQQAKVQHLLLNIDSKFCLNLECHRHPVPPLRTMLKILEEGSYQELLQMDLSRV
ncbi:MAG: hypothetical protein GQ582_03070 [Methyloprofundus sp.]|nr:hypothetical protein [Methyloprofundus sp.]